MFTVDCPIRAATVLIWRCNCRQPAVLVTGRHAAGEVLRHPRHRRRRAARRLTDTKKEIAP